VKLCFNKKLKAEVSLYLICPHINTTGMEKLPTFHFQNGKKSGGSLWQFPPKKEMLVGW
jgi:hypothetical protein